MKRLRTALILVFVFSLALFGYTKFQENMTGGNTAPEIYADEGMDKEVTISVADGKEGMYVGLHAKDSEDGDLTDQIIIEQRSAITKDHKIDVTYVVFDSEGEGTTFSRTVCYSDYTTPRILLAEPLAAALGQSFEVRPSLIAEDAIDGDISDKIQILNSTLNTSIAGTYTITLKVENSIGDSTTLDVPIVIEQRTESTPTLTLTDAIVYLKVGAEFHPRDYIESIVNCYGDVYTNDTVNVVSNVDTSTPGSYVVTYVGWDGNNSTKRCLDVVVEE